jgi:predicted PurR-regulated permease PerM
VSGRLPYRAVVLVAVLVAVGLLFEQLATLLLAIVVAVVIGLPIAAGASWLERRRVPRPLGAIVCLLAGVGVVGALLGLIIPQFVEQARSFANQLPGFIAHAEHYFHLKPGTVSKTTERLATTYTQHPAKLLGPLTSIALTVADAIGILIVILISALYGAINPDPLVRGVVRLAPLEQRDEVMRVLGRIRTAWLGWLRGIAVDMLVLGGLLFVGMKLVGLPFALGFAVFSALMTVIPNYGSVISAGPPILVGLSQSVHEAVLVTIVYVIVNQIEGNLVLPLIMGRSVNVHPAAVAIAVLIAGALFGVVGLFIAIPLLSLALIAIEELWILPLERKSLALGRLSGSETRQRRSPQRDVYGAIFLAVLLLVVGMLVQQLATLLLVIAMTIIFSLPLASAGNALRRWGVPRPLGALIGLIAILSAIAGLIVALVPTVSAQVKTLTTNAPQLASSAEAQLARLLGKRPGPVATQIQQSVSNYVDHPTHYLGDLESIGLTATSIVAGIVIAVMTAYFIAAQPDPLIDGVARLFPPRRRVEARRVLARLRGAMLGWMQGVLIAMVLVGLMLYIGLGLVVGLPFALFFAVLSGIAEVIPYLGSIASGVPPVAYALTISPTKALIVLAIYIAVHQFEANVIGPLIMARTVHLHPAVIAFGVVAVGAIFGFIGLLIAIPILATVIILVEEVWIKPHEPQLVTPRTAAQPPNLPPAERQVGA